MFSALEVMQFARDAHLADEWIGQNKHNIGEKATNEVRKIIQIRDFASKVTWKK